MTAQTNWPLRMHVVWRVLEAALDAQDGQVVAACRRCIDANRLGRRFGQDDWQLISAFA